MVRIGKNTIFVAPEPDVGAAAGQHVGPCDAAAVDGGGARALRRRSPPQERPPRPRRGRGPGRRPGPRRFRVRGSEGGPGGLGGQRLGRRPRPHSRGWRPGRLGGRRAVGPGSRAGRWPGSRRGSRDVIGPGRPWGLGLGRLRRSGPGLGSSTQAGVTLQTPIRGRGPAAVAAGTRHDSGRQAGPARPAALRLAVRAAVTERAATDWDQIFPSATRLSGKRKKISKHTAKNAKRQ